MNLFKLLFCLGICPGVELLDQMIVLFLVFEGTSILFSILPISIYIPTNNVIFSSNQCSKRKEFTHQSSNEDTLAKGYLQR